MHTEEKLPFQVYRNSVYEQDRRLFAAQKVRETHQAIFSPSKSVVEKTRNITQLYNAVERMEQSPSLASRQNNTEKKMKANLLVVPAESLRSSETLLQSSLTPTRRTKAPAAHRTNPTLRSSRSSTLLRPRVSHRVQTETPSVDRLILTTSSTVPSRQTSCRP